MGFLGLRKKLISWLAKDDIIVIINTATYDSVIEANNKLFPNNCLIRSNKVVKFDVIMETEVNQRLELRKQGISKQGNAFVLKEI
jgi:hypothetical protein